MEMEERERTERREKKRIVIDGDGDTIVEVGVEKG